MNTQQPRQRQPVAYHPVTQPTNRRLPPKLKETCPLAAQYEQLLKAEERIDATIMRRRYDMQDALNRPIKVARTMRIWCSNTVRDQAWQLTGAGIEANNFDFENDTVPSWTLRIMAAILPDQNHDRGGDDDDGEGDIAAPLPQFTDLVRSVVIEEETTTAFEGLNYSEGPILQYERPPATRSMAGGVAPSSPPPPPPSLPGIEIKRKGDSDLRLKISITLENSPERYKLQPKLAQLLDTETATRGEIMSSLWNYVQAERLQDSEEKRLIHADAALRDVFGQERLFFPDLPKAINGLLLPLDPVVLYYDLRTDRARTVAPVCWDVEVLLDAPLVGTYRAVLRELQAAAPRLAALDGEIAAGVVEIEASLAKRDFLDSYAANPAAFIRDWLASQNEDMEVLMGEVRKVSGEQARRANFYKEGQDWLREGIFHYLSEPRVV